MKEASLFLKAGDTPFLPLFSNNVLQGRTPSLSFFTKMAHESHLRMIWTWVWTWVWALTLLAQTWIKSSWKGKRRQRRSSHSRGEAPPPACLCSPSYQALLHSRVLAARLVQNWVSSHCPWLLSFLFSADFSIALDWAYHTTTVNSGFCSLPLPCKKTSSLSAED